MIASEPTRATLKRLNAAGFTRRNAKGSHAMYRCPHGDVAVLVADDPALCHRMPPTGRSKGAIVTSYHVDVRRESRWWIIRVPQLDGADGLEECVGQARRYTDITKEARDIITVAADVAPSTIDLDVHVRVDDIDVSAVAETIARERAVAAAADARARQASLDAAKRLKAAGVPVRDIGAVTGLSFQRAQQLADT